MGRRVGLRRAEVPGVLDVSPHVVRVIARPKISQDCATQRAYSLSRARRLRPTLSFTSRGRDPSLRASSDSRVPTRLADDRAPFDDDANAITDAPRKNAAHHHARVVPHDDRRRGAWSGKWTEGQTIAAGDVLADIETDKATMALESMEDGVVAKILVQNGAADVEVGTVLGVRRTRRMLARSPITKRRLRRRRRTPPEALNVSRRRWIRFRV